MSVQNILDRKGTEVFTVDPTATVRTAAQLMRARGIAALVVKTADLINGLISGTSSTLLRSTESARLQWPCRKL